MSTSHLASTLETYPQQWQFVQAIRVLSSPAAPDNVSLNLISDPGYRTVAAEVTAVSRFGSQWQLSVTLPALTGCAGVLPYGYQDTAHRLRVGSDNNGLQDFYNIFSQRVLWNSYQAITRNRLICRFERGLQPGYAEEKNLGRQLSALAGVVKPNTIPVDHLPRYVGLLGQKNTSPALLKQVLEDYFGLEVDVIPVALRKQYLGQEFRTALSTWKTDTNQLGQGALLGKTAWLAQGRVNIHLHIKSEQQMHQFEQDHSLVPCVREFCRLLTGGRVDVEVFFKCSAELIPQAQLVSRPNRLASKASALGMGVGLHSPSTVKRRSISDAVITLGSHRSGLRSQTNPNKQSATDV